MRKTITGTAVAGNSQNRSDRSDQFDRSDRLDLDRLGRVEVSSEAAGHPIESALVAGGSGWRADSPGEQTIRLVFDQPRAVKRVELRFAETERARTQQFVLRWLPAGEDAYREIVRQQYTFSPPSTTEETEQYAVELERVSALELRVVPDISGGEAHASLAEMALF